MGNAASFARFQFLIFVHIFCVLSKSPNYAFFNIENVMAYLLMKILSCQEYLFLNGTTLAITTVVPEDHQIPKMYLLQTKC